MDLLPETCSCRVVFHTAIHQDAPQVSIVFNPLPMTDIGLLRYCRFLKRPVYYGSVTTPLLKAHYDLTRYPTGYTPLEGQNGSANLEFQQKF